MSSNGYDTIANALNQAYQQYRYDTRYGDIDWSESIKGLFNRKRQPNIDPSSSVIGEFSADNPLLAEAQKINNPNSFLKRKPTALLKQEMTDWETNKRKQSMAEELANLEIENNKGQYITLDQNTLNQIPPQYRSFYQPGQRVKRNEVMGLIPEPLKQTSSESNANLNRLYQGVLDSYAQYQTNIKNRRDPDTGVSPETTPLSLESWLRQPGREGLLNTYNQFTGGSLKSLPSPYSTKTPEQITAAEQKKAQTRMASYQTNDDYGPEVWGETDKDVSKFGGPGAALTYYLKNGGTTPQRLLALLDRYNQNLKKQGINKEYTLTDYKKKFINKKTGDNKGTLIAFE